jgi:hypothetical protein
MLPSPYCAGRAGHASSRRSKTSIVFVDEAVFATMSSAGATSARSCSVMSLVTGEDLPSFRLGHSQDVLKLHEMVQLGRFFRRQACFLLTFDQLSDSTLCFGRGAEIGNRL